MQTPDAAGSSIIRGEDASQLHELEEFHAACGCGRWLLFEIDAPDAGQPPVQVVAERPFALIGRGADCDIQLPHPEVSYRHAYLQSVAGRVMCFDLASRGGTHWQAGPRPSGPLRPGDDLRIGPYRVRLCPDEFAEGFDSADAEHNGHDAAGPPPEFALEFLNVSTQPVPWPVRHEVTLVGHHRACKVRLTDDSVSRVHCSLVRAGDGLWVIDLLGRGGTCVNGEAVPFARLDEGDEFQVGRFRIRLTRPSAAPAPADTPCAPADASQSLSGKGDRHPSFCGHSEPELQQAGASPLFRTDSHALLTSLVRELGLWQQQMAEQSQQTLAAVTYLLCRMHPEPEDVLRQSFDPIDELTDELRQLRQQLAQVRDASDEPAQSIERNSRLCEQLLSKERQRSAHWQHLLRSLMEDR